MTQNIQHIPKNEPDLASAIARIEYWCGKVSEAFAITGSEWSDIAHVDCEVVHRCQGRGRQHLSLWAW